MPYKFIAALAFAGCALPLLAQGDAEAAPDTTVGSQVFFDASNLSNQQNSNLPSKVNVAPSGNGFDVKRLYLTVDHKFNDVWSANLTTDAQFLSTPSVVLNPAPTAPTTVVTANTGGVTEVFVKKLYLQAKLSDALNLRIGSYTAPWVPFVESLYGYRWVEKTVADRFGFANTADWGINAGGKFADTGLSYSVSAINGGGFKNPSRSKTVDVEARVAYVPLPGLTIGIGGYEGHLGQVTALNESFNKHTATRLDATVAYTIAGFRVGGEYYRAKNFKTVNNATAGLFGTSAVVASTATGLVTSDTATGGSIWASYAFAEQYAVFARADDNKLSKDVLPSLKDKFFLVGVGFKPLKTIDLALVYKREAVQHGAVSVSSADANGSYTTGGSTAANDGKFSEVGLYAQWAF